MISTTTSTCLYESLVVWKAVLKGTSYVTAVVSRLIVLSRCHTLIPRIWEYIMLHGKEELDLQIEVRLLMNELMGK